MTIRKIRRSVLVTAGVAALAMSGLAAGQLVARQKDQGMDAPRMFRHLARRLELTDAQQTQIRGILKSHADDIEARVKSGMEARRALRDAVMAQPTDSTAIRSLAQQVGAAHADGAILFAKVRSEIWPILTPAQQDKVQGFHARKRDRADHMLDSLGEWLRSDL